MASATPKRGVGETSLIGRGMLFLGRIQALEGAGGAYEDEKAAFALSSCIGSFRGARSTTPRPHTPSSCGEKNPGRNHGSQIEHLEPPSRVVQRPTLKHSSIRIGHPTGLRTTMILSTLVHFQRPSLTLSTSGSGTAPASA